jgi:hypothetical protein
MTVPSVIHLAGQNETTDAATTTTAVDRQEEEVEETVGAMRVTGDGTATLTALEAAMTAATWTRVPSTLR